jgi:hypothetical protein
VAEGLNLSVRVDTCTQTEMNENRDLRSRLLVAQKRDGRREFDEDAVRELVAQCLKPSMSERLDVQFVRRAPEVRHAAPGLVGPDTAEHAGLVAVQRHRFAMTLQVRTRSLEVASMGYSKSSPLDDSFVRKILL